MSSGSREKSTMSLRAGPRYQASRSTPSRTKPQRSATRSDAVLASAACRSRRRSRPP